MQKFFYALGLLGFVLTPFFAFGATITENVTTNRNSNIALDPVDNYAIGQCFSPTGDWTLTSATFYPKRTGSVSGNSNAKIYAVSGSCGTNGVPTGSALATSDNTNTNTFSTSYTIATYNFSGGEQITLTSGANYFIVFQMGTIADACGDGFTTYCEAGDNSTDATHGGNEAVYNGAWSANAKDMVFAVYGTEEEGGEEESVASSTSINWGSATTTNYFLGSVAFGLAVIITLLSIGFVAFIFNKVSKKKPWQ